MSTTQIGDEGFERRLLLGAAGLAGVAALARMGQAGPLTPPAGVVASTGKTLTSVEPRIEINATNTPGSATALYVISQPGSYYLAGNLTPAAGKHGIQVLSDNVTVDLMGYQVLGNLSGSALHGITTSAQGVTILNGIVRAWSGSGVDAISAIRMRLEGIQVANNVQNGILAGMETLVSGCASHLNGLSGITVRAGSVVERCVVRECGTAGLYAFDGQAVIHGCVSHSNQTGISGLSSSLIEGCNAMFNQVIGISVGSNSRVVNCHASTNGTISGGSTSGSGFLATGSRNRIEGNSSTGNDRGFAVNSGANLVVRNSAGGNNRNWDVVTGNACQVIAATTGAAISGNAGGAALGSADPWVNFTV